MKRRRRRRSVVISYLSTTNDVARPDAKEVRTCMSRKRNQFPIVFHSHSITYTFSVGGKRQWTIRHGHIILVSCPRVRQASMLHLVWFTTTCMLKYDFKFTFSTLIQWATTQQDHVKLENKNNRNFGMKLICVCGWVGVSVLHSYLVKYYSLTAFFAKNNAGALYFSNISSAVLKESRQLYYTFIFYAGVY